MGGKQTSALSSEFCTVHVLYTCKGTEEPVRFTEITGIAGRLHFRDYNVWLLMEKQSVLWQNVR